MNKFIFIADFFASELPGGGEMNNKEVVLTLQEAGNQVQTVNCRDVSPEHLKEDANYIIGNFVQLSEASKRALEAEKRYIIYEHDHKYIASRNPADYLGYVAPKEHIINYDFYKNALAVLCQSNFHKKIAESNLGLKNLVSLGGNMWSTESLELMREYANKEKTNILP